MKQTFLFFFALILLGSCIHDDVDLHVDEDSNLMIDERFLMEEPYNVPLEAGKVTVVTLNGDTIAVTDIPLTISVPTTLKTRSATSEASEGLKVFHLNYAQLPSFEPGSYINEGNRVLFFEDSFKADYDYNDLIVYVKTAFLGKAEDGKRRKCTVKVRGLALGSTKQIGFGFTDMKGQSHLLTDNVRRDYFGGKQGFVNTLQGEVFVPGIENIDGKADERGNNYTIVYSAKDKNSEMSGGGYIIHDEIITENTNEADNGWKNVSFYISVDNGKKLYIASIDATLGEACPYGLSLAISGDLIYPLEKTYIGDAFPDFDDWVSGKLGTTGTWVKNPDKSKCYSVSATALWRW